MKIPSLLDTLPRDNGREFRMRCLELAVRLGKGSFETCNAAQMFVDWAMKGEVDDAGQAQVPDGTDETQAQEDRAQA